MPSHGIAYVLGHRFGSEGPHGFHEHAAGSDNHFVLAAFRLPFYFVDNDMIPCLLLNGVHHRIAGNFPNGLPGSGSDLVHADRFLFDVVGRRKSINEKRKRNSRQQPGADTSFHL